MGKIIDRELRVLSNLYNDLLGEKSALESKRDSLINELCLVNADMKIKTSEMIRIDGLRNEIFDYENKKNKPSKKVSFYSERK